MKCTEELNIRKFFVEQSMMGHSSHTSRNKLMWNFTSETNIHIECKEK